MLRVEFQDVSGVTMIRMEGRFVGKFAEDSRELILRSQFPSKLVIDLSEISFVDEVGEEVLSVFGRIGMKFVANGNVYARDICQRLRLPLSRKIASTQPRNMYFDEPPRQER
jgi:hypothetical protein